MTRVYTKIVLDIETMRMVESEGFDYSGELCECKGQKTAKKQLDQQNLLVQQQLARQNALQDEAIKAVRPFLNGSIGFDPELLALAKSQFLNSNDAQFANAGNDVRQSLLARGAAGGELPVGGDFVRDISELQGLKAQSQASGLLGIDVESLRQALNNKFNAANVFGGNTAQIGQNVGAFNAGASDALRQFIVAKNSPGFLSGIGGILGQAAAGFGSGFAGSLGKSSGGGGN